MPIRLLTKKQHVYGGRRYQPGETYLARTVSDARTLRAVGFVVLAPEPVAVATQAEPLNDTLPDLPPVPGLLVPPLPSLMPTELDEPVPVALEPEELDEPEDPADEPPTDPPKRKRGRPRKIQTPEG